MPVLARLESEGCRGCIIVPKQPSLPFWSILQPGLVGGGVEVEGKDLRGPAGVQRRSEALNMYLVCMFDFSRRAPLNLRLKPDSHKEYDRA